MTVEVKASIEVGEMGVPLRDRIGEREPIVLLVSFSPAVEFQEGRNGGNCSIEGYLQVDYIPNVWRQTRSD